MDKKEIDVKTMGITYGDPERSELGVRMDYRRNKIGKETVIKKYISIWKSFEDLCTAFRYQALSRQVSELETCEAVRRGRLDISSFEESEKRRITKEAENDKVKVLPYILKAELMIKEEDEKKKARVNEGGTLV